MKDYIESELTDEAIASLIHNNVESLFSPGCYMTHPCDDLYDPDVGACLLDRESAFDISDHFRSFSNVRNINDF